MSKNNKHIWVTGKHAVTSLLSHSPERAIALYIQQSNNSKYTHLITLAEKIGLTVFVLDKISLSKRCGSDQNQGIAVEAKHK